MISDKQYKQLHYVHQRTGSRLVGRQRLNTIADVLQQKRFAAVELLFKIFAKLKKLLLQRQVSLWLPLI